MWGHLVWKIISSLSLVSSSPNFLYPTLGGTCMKRNKEKITLISLIQNMFRMKWKIVLTQEIHIDTMKTKVKNIVQAQWQNCDNYLWKERSAMLIHKNHITRGWNFIYNNSKFLRGKTPNPKIMLMLGVMLRFTKKQSLARTINFCMLFFLGLL